MRVLMVTTSFPRWDGDHAGHFIASLAEEIVQLGHQVTVIAPHERSLPADQTVRGVRVLRFRYLPEWAERLAYGSGIVENLKREPLAVVGLLPFAHAIRAAVRQQASSFDIVHVHWAPTAEFAAPWRARVPYVVTLHGSDVTLARSGGVLRALLSRALRRASGTGVVADDQRAFLLEAGLWDEDRPLAVAPAGVADSLFNEPKATATHQPFRFLFAGRLVQSKGVFDLLQAFRSLQSEGIDATLQFVGTGPAEESLEDAAAGDDAVTLTGAASHDETLEAIAAADALVLPSYGEGSPLVVTESLALGTPVIGSRVGAIPELVGDERLLVDPGDISALTTAMRLVANDDDLWREASTAARVRMRRERSWPRIAAVTVDLYRRSLASAPSTRTDRVG